MSTRQPMPSSGFEYAGASRPEVNLAVVDDNGQAATLANASSKSKNNIIQLLSPTNVAIRVKDHVVAKVRLEQLEIRASTRGKDQTKTYRSFVQSDGFFEFQEISAGDYTFRIPSTEIETAGGMHMQQPIPMNLGLLNLGIDIAESVAEGQSRELGVIEAKNLKQR